VTANSLFLIVRLAAVAAVYFWYASIVGRRNKVQEVLRSVDAHWNQRHDLIPNIVALTGRYTQHTSSGTSGR